MSLLHSTSVRTASPSYRFLSQAAPPRRPAERPLPARSTKGLVLRVVRSALADDWALHDAADELVRYVDGDIRMLQVARARILSCVGPTATAVQARTLAALDVALTRAQAQALGSRP